jgi:hypothetical protein
VSPFLTRSVGLEPKNLSLSARLRARKMSLSMVRSVGLEPKKLSVSASANAAKRQAASADKKFLGSVLPLNFNHFEL